jgi:hypothetical protein
MLHFVIDIDSFDLPRRCVRATGRGALAPPLALGAAAAAPAYGCGTPAEIVAHIAAYARLRGLEIVR